MAGDSARRQSGICLLTVEPGYVTKTRQRLEISGWPSWDELASALVQADGHLAGRDAVLVVQPQGMIPSVVTSCQEWEACAVAMDSAAVRLTVLNPRGSPLSLGFPDSMVPKETPDAIVADSFERITAEPPLLQVNLPSPYLSGSDQSLDHCDDTNSAVLSSPAISSPVEVNGIAAGLEALALHSDADRRPSVTSKDGTHSSATPTTLPQKARRSFTAPATGLPTPVSTAPLSAPPTRAAPPRSAKQPDWLLPLVHNDTLHRRRSERRPLHPLMITTTNEPHDHRRIVDAAWMPTPGLEAPEHQRENWRGSWGNWFAWSP